MSSLEPEMSFEELIRSRHPSLSLFLPFILGFATPAPSQDRQESGESQTVRQRIILINPLAESMMVIEGSGNLEAMFRELSSKDGPLPASKASIEAMPVVKTAEEGTECAICLAEYEVGGEAKEMPCKHRYHSGCIEKWLGIHGSCPVCRYKMPVEEEDGKKTGDSGDEEEGRGRRVEGGIQVTFYMGGGDRRDPISGQSANNSSDSSRRDDDDDVAADGSSTQDMEIDHVAADGSSMEIDYN